MVVDDVALTLLDRAEQRQTVGQSAKAVTTACNALRAEMLEQYLKKGVVLGTTRKW